MNPFTRPISRAILLVLVAAGISSAAIVPITSVQAGANRKLPYTLESLTVDDFTITRESLVLGRSSGSAFLGSDIRYADDFDLNTVAARTASGIWQVTKLGGLDTYSDTNGAAPDFFVFEAGMNDPLTIQAILSDGSLGKTVTIAASAWGDTGLDRLGILNAVSAHRRRGLRDHGFIGLERPASRFRRRDSRPPVQQPGRGSRPFLGGDDGPGACHPGDSGPGRPARDAASVLSPVDVQGSPLHFGLAWTGPDSRFGRVGTREPPRKGRKETFLRTSPPNRAAPAIKYRCGASFHSGIDKDHTGITGHQTGMPEQ